MMTSYFNLLKYAATGIASPDMSYYDRMRASTLMGGGAVQTLTGQPPLSFKADGTPITVWSMKGNGSQTGTPTPDAPIQPQFVGVRTANLCKIIGFDSGATEQKLLQTVVLNAGTYTYSCIQNDTLASNTRNCLMVRVGQDPYIYEYTLPNYHLSAGKHTLTFTVTADNTSVELRYWINGFSNVCHFDDFMLNSGSTALPYEPYGWAEKITCAGQTTPVYLGEVPTVRRIKKLVLDGTEAWSAYASIADCYRLDIRTAPGVTGNGICSHYAKVESTAQLTDETFVQGQNFSYFKDVSAQNLDGWKSYLAQQYTAGTPVTIWYVLSTPTTGIVNEPLCKIGDYADELSSTDAGVAIPTVKGNNTLTVETDLQPSEMSITYRG